MKKIAQLSLVLIFLFTLAPAQIKAQQPPEQELSIYVKALNKYAQWINKFEPETDTLYFEELRGITTLFPKEVNGLKIEILTGRNQRKIFSDHGGELIQRKMTPVKVTGKELEVGIIPYQGRMDAQRGVILSLSKWHAVIFAYNPSTETFEYNRFENR